MCELLAQKSPSLDPEQAFTVGLFSTLDAVMGRPMEELLDNVSLSGPIKFALHRREGPLGELLSRVLRDERGE
jgi:EAL and modified HD-GYP domain-containing signal transduction protein